MDRALKQWDRAGFLQVMSEREGKWNKGKEREKDDYKCYGTHLGEERGREWKMRSKKLFQIGERRCPNWLHAFPAPSLLRGFNADIPKRIQSSQFFFPQSSLLHYNFTLISLFPRLLLLEPALALFASCPHCMPLSLLCPHCADLKQCQGPDLMHSQADRARKTAVPLLALQLFHWMEQSKTNSEVENEYSIYTNVKHKWV